MDLNAGEMKLSCIQLDGNGSMEVYITHHLVGIGHGHRAMEDRMRFQ